MGIWNPRIPDVGQAFSALGNLIPIGKSTAYPVLRGRIAPC